MIERIKEYYTFHKSMVNMIIGITIILLVSSACIYVFYKTDKENNTTHIDNDIVMNENEVEKTEVESENNLKLETIFIDIKGSVVSEGVYEVNTGSRVIDVITKAGGLKNDANTRFINLSKVVNDGDVIVIYSNQEIEEAQKSNIIYVETPCICEKVNNDACIKDNTNNSGKLVNINTASTHELMTIDGIGEVKATAIIDYRTENGLYNSIEDILNVSGISENLFEKIKTFITT